MAPKKGDCLYWNWKGCKVKKKSTKRKGQFGLRLKFKKNKKNKSKRKGLNKWVKGAIAAIAPSAAAVGYGLIKTLLKKNTGYEDIYA
ncbi:MAG: hypothetical protein ACRDDH_00060 [Cetobacterium sp.]